MPRGIERTLIQIMKPGIPQVNTNQVKQRRAPLGKGESQDSTTIPKPVMMAQVEGSAIQMDPKIVQMGGNISDYGQWKIIIEAYDLEVGLHTFYLPETNTTLEITKKFKRDMRYRNVEEYWCREQGF